ncbi:hypothetical protein CPB86DRAFT_733668, partial [Serendipita vermifera]
MSFLVFIGISVEQAVKEDSFLTNIPHLKLELFVNGRVVDQVELASHRSGPGLWRSEEGLMLWDVSEDFKLSVSLDVGENEYLLMGSTELSGLELYDVLGNIIELPLMAQEDCPKLILKTKVGAMDTETLHQIASTSSQYGVQPTKKIAVTRLYDDAVRAIQSFERHGDLRSLEQAISKLQVVSE